MKPKNSKQNHPEKNDKKVENLDVLEHINKKGKLQNKILKKIVEQLNEQEKDMPDKTKKK